MTVHLTTNYTAAINNSSLSGQACSHVILLLALTLSAMIKQQVFITTRSWRWISKEKTVLFYSAIHLKVLWRPYGHRRETALPLDLVSIFKVCKGLPLVTLPLSIKMAKD